MTSLAVAHPASDEQMDDPGARARNLRRGAARSRPGQRWTFTARPTLALPEARGARACPPSACSTSASAMATCCGGSRAGRGGATSPSTWSASISTRTAPRRRGRRRRPHGRSNIAPATIATSPAPFDFVVSSLVAHHMTDDQLDAFIRFMEEQATPRLADQRPPPAPLRLLRLSLAGAADRRAPHRPRGRAIVDRALLPPRRMAGDPRRRGRARGRGADRPALPVPAVRRTAALIVGGGPAGAAAAIALARGGAMPVLIERAPGERDLVCGGFLGWDAIGRAAAGWGSIRPRSARGRSSGCGWSRARRSSRQALPKAGGRAVAAAARRGPAADGRGGGGGGAARAGGARGRGAAASGSTTARRWRADALFLATGKHELRGVARDDRRARRSRSACAPRFTPRPTRRATWPGRSSCISMTAAMPGCCCRRTAASISACRSRRRG